MTSVPQEHLVPQVVEAMQNVLEEAAERLAWPTGLIQRRGGKVTGARLAQTLVLGWMARPDASLEEMAQHAAAVGLDITAQGIDERFTMRTAVFLQALFEVALGQVVMADPVAIPLLSRFAGVVVEDSTIIELPEELAPLFRGTAGDGSAASCKVFVRWDLLRGGLTCSQLCPGKQHDCTSPLQHLPLPARVLHLRDKGFISLKRWQQELDQEQYVLSYLRGDVVLLDRAGCRLDLVEWLSQAEATGEREVLVGSAQRLPMRLVFSRVPEEVAQERRRRGKREAEIRRQPYSERLSLLAGWTLVVTNVPASLLSLSEVLVLLRLRWQIELLFKLWKQAGLVDEWRTRKPVRMLCELSAKLIGVLIQHWVLIISCWQQPHRSLVKAAKAIRHNVALLAAAFDGDLSLHVAVSRLQKLALAGARLNSRRDAPNTSQMLFTGISQWSSKPLRKRSLR